MLFNSTKGVWILYDLKIGCVENGGKSLIFAWILNSGWRIVQPLVKLYYRVMKRCSFDRGAYLSYLTKFEGNNRIGRNTYVPGTIMGYGSYISDNSHFFHVQIGRYCCIGARTAVICGRHPIDKFVSVHPFFFRGKENGFSYVEKSIFDEYVYADKDTKTSVIIGNDVWIGADAKIMEGVTIGDGAVIAANSLVLKDVEPYAVVAGVPAKVIKYRFEPEKREYLLNIKWWEKPQKWISENATLFSDIEVFINKQKE